MILESPVTRGAIIYLESIERDLANGRLTFRLLGTVKNGHSLQPILGPVVRVVRFTGISNFQEFWNEEEPAGLMEQIIGIVETPQGTGYAYVIRLYLSEVRFDSDTYPSVKDV